jgi:ubiquitin thioesterase ZRANB1
MNANRLGYALTPRQLRREWATAIQSAAQPGASLDQIHIFVLAHIFRRPIIVYGVKYIKSFRGEVLGFAKFEGKKIAKTILSFDSMGLFVVMIRALN